MKKPIFIFVFCAATLSCLGWGLMKKGVAIGGSGEASNNPVRGPGDAILDLGGVNINGFGGENILGIGPIIQ